ncbi:MULTISPECIES: hypothetical protein [Streptomyces]|uniref:Uncharacterized protein n=1 Tax=Streptomyces lycii TaxID=2654337 RepID=A0ABQ7FLU6_9ACTN|nr:MULTISPECIES: hypothetical protein [Streptomyces]KAF4409370.1 hypothetical protein GCU69_09365 [Streptomyces lycii]PGH47017.1 hypothetical protein CRI70_30860 [Streptomyces sp. Ru87]
MSGNVIHGGTQIGCPHGGRVDAAASAGSAASGVRLDGTPVATAAHAHAVTGCRHTVDRVPVPCTSVRWTPAGDGVLVDGSPVLLDVTAAQCFNAALVPQGAPRIVSAPQGVVCG